MAEVILFHLTTSHGSWRIRIDKPHGQEAHHQEHVHVGRRGLKGEYSWNRDGTRHDKHRFPASEKQIIRAKKLAADALDVPFAALQFIAAVDGRHHVSVSAYSDTGRARRLLTTYVRVKERLVFLSSQRGLVIVVLEEA